MDATERDDGDHVAWEVDAAREDVRGEGGGGNVARERDGASDDGGPRDVACEDDAAYGTDGVGTGLDDAASGGGRRASGGDVPGSFVSDGAAPFRAPASWPAPLPGTRSPDAAPWPPGPTLPGASSTTKPVGRDAPSGRGETAVRGIPTSPAGPGWAAFGYPLAHDALGGQPHVGNALPPYAVGPPYGASSPATSADVAAQSVAGAHAAYLAPLLKPTAPSPAPPHAASSGPHPAPFASPHVASSAPHVAPSGALPSAAGAARAALALGVVAVLSYGLAFILDTGGAVAFWFLGLATGVLAVVFGAVGAGRARRAGGPGRGMSLAGLVCGIVGLAGGLAVVLAGVVLAAGEGNDASGRTHEHHAHASYGAPHGTRATSR